MPTMIPETKEQFEIYLWSKLDRHLQEELTKSLIPFTNFVVVATEKLSKHDISINSVQQEQRHCGERFSAMAKNAEKIQNLEKAGNICMHHEYLQKSINEILIKVGIKSYVSHLLWFVVTVLVAALAYHAR